MTRWRVIISTPSPRVITLYACVCWWVVVDGRMMRCSDWKRVFWSLCAKWVIKFCEFFLHLSWSRTGVLQLISSLHSDGRRRHSWMKEGLFWTDAGKISSEDHLYRLIVIGYVLHKNHEYPISIYYLPVVCTRFTSQSDDCQHCLFVRKTQYIRLNIHGMAKSQISASRFSRFVKHFKFAYSKMHA